MLISRKKNFIFIHIPKCGGTSVHNALRGYAELYQRFFNNLYDRNLLEINIRTPFLNIYNFGGHCHAYQIEYVLGRDKFERFFSFSFVRNPWDREVSEYHYALRGPHRRHREVKGLKDFDDFLNWRFTSDIKSCKTQRSYLVDINGKLLVDHVGKVHSMDHDFNEICKMLNIEATLERKNRSDHRRYVDYYKERTVKMVEEVYKEDVETFGFAFGD